LFGISAFTQTPFASVPSAATPVPVEIPLGGHFGFDEKKRDAQWDKDRKLEAQRKLKLQEALFGLPPEAREQITSAPDQTIEIAAANRIDYDALMQRVKALDIQIKEQERKRRFDRDEQDIMRILELI
jgi:hypothetical protein